MNRSTLLRTIPVFLCAAGLAHAQVVKFPRAPSNLRVKALGVNSFRLDWQDNSNNEAGWEIRAALKGTTPTRFVLFPVPNAKSYILILSNSLPGKELSFQMAAYNYAGATEQLSKVTSVVTAKALSPTTFKAPTELTAKVLDDSRIRLVWRDNATSEFGYQMEFKKTSSPTWGPLGNVQAGTNFSITTSGFSPSTSYQFRVRAFRDNPLQLTAYTTVVKAKTTAFRAPSDLVATAQSDGQLSFKWKDRSSLEAGYELEQKVGTGEFVMRGTVPANTSTTDPVQFQLKTDYSFRIRAFRFEGTAKIYSGYSNTFSIRSSALSRPSSLVATAPTDSTVSLTWADSSKLESGFEINYGEVGAGFPTTQKVLANVLSYQPPKLKPGTLYEFRVRAYRDANFFTGAVAAASGFTNTVQLRTLDGIGGDFHPPVFFGTSFEYPIQVSRESALTGFTVTGLPAGLTYNSATHTISGTPAVDGVKKITLAATFSASPAVTRELVLRIVRPPAPPVIVQAFGAASVAVSASGNVPLAGKFADPDTASAARVATSLGNFDIILYSQATPQTVNNFLDYVDAGDFNDSFFHRSVADFVVQGGGYRYTPAAGFTLITKRPAITNEPGISNLKGTVAMAKISGDPDSATDEFFVNVNDANAANLDFQNDGFTVFGRIPDAGMTVVDAINDLPTKQYSVPPFGSSAFGSLPVNATTAPAELDPTKLVQVTSVTAAPILRYNAVSQNAAIVTATVSGTDVVITGVASGSTTVRVTATDLDGATVTQELPVTVP